jgi:hypothetical protein
VQPSARSTWKRHIRNHPLRRGNLSLDPSSNITLLILSVPRSHGTDRLPPHRLSRALRQLRPTEEARAIQPKFPKRRCIQSVFDPMLMLNIFSPVPTTYTVGLELDALSLPHLVPSSQGANTVRPGTVGKNFQPHTIQSNPSFEAIVLSAAKTT